MKLNRFLTLSSATSAMILTSPASAVYTGLSVAHQSVMAGGELRNVYRVYATFSDPNDYLVAVFGSPIAGPMVIQSRNVDDTVPGGDFFNPIPSDRAPTALQVFGGTDQNGDPIPPIPDAAYETFCTIGVGNSGEAPGGVDGTDLTPNTPTWLPFINGNQLVTSNGGWFRPTGEQGRAGYTGDGDLLLRVLMMQLTVSSTSNVRGTVNISGVNQTPLAGAVSFNISGQTFNSIPGPGTLIVLGLGLISGRRRRVVLQPGRST